MGGVCTGGTMKHHPDFNDKNDSGFSGKLKSIKSFAKQKTRKDDGDDLGSSYSYHPDLEVYEKKRTPHIFDSGELHFSISRELKPSTPARTVAAKGPHTGSFLGKAGIVGLERAVDVLDTLGSSMTNLNVGSGFTSNLASRGNKISILAFEVANTIAKGSNLLQSISEENIQFLKKEILHSEGVQLLVSTDMTELLRIAASDKREEFSVFSREVIRFGDLCKDPQWHNLGRYFSRLDTDAVTQKQLREEAEMTMQELTTLAQYTSELYHELHALDRFEQDYRRKLEEVESLRLPRKGEGLMILHSELKHQRKLVRSLQKKYLWSKNLEEELYHELHALDKFEQDYQRKLEEVESLPFPRRGEGLMILHSELKHQRKLVRSLKKKSLWSKSLEEIVEKLVDIVTFIHQDILKAFGENAVTATGNKTSNKPERLGVAGLALHHAHIVTQIDNIACRPTSLPPNTRDGLYNGLPVSVKTSLRSRLQTFDAKEELTVPQIKAEMEKTLQWLVPIALDTTKAHQGFGRVGEWANTGIEFGGKNTATNNSVIRLQTLYHADKQKMDEYILELVIYLHRLINLVRYRDNGFRALGKSKSQEFVMGKRGSTKVWSPSRSTRSSPRRTLEHGQSKSSILDIMDGIDQHFELLPI